MSFCSRAASSRSPVFMAMLICTFMSNLRASREIRFRSCRAAHVESGTHTGEGAVARAGAEGSVVRARGGAVAGTGLVEGVARAVRAGRTGCALVAALGAGSAVAVIAVGAEVGGEVAAVETITVGTTTGAVGAVLSAGEVAFRVTQVASAPCGDTGQDDGAQGARDH